MSRLTDDMLEFLASGVAHQVGGCTADGRPLICRALAAEFPDDEDYKSRLADLLKLQAQHFGPKDAEQSAQTKTAETPK